MNKDIAYWFTKEGIQEFLEIKRQKYLQKLGKNSCTLHIIHKNNDPRSQIYVNNKCKRAADYNIGIVLNRKKDYYANNQELVMIQQPYEPYPGVPPEEGKKLINSFFSSTPSIDVEGVANYSLLNQLKNPSEATWPCTARGIYEHAMFVSKMYNEHLEGELAVIIGRSDIVGKPVAKMFESLANMTVVQCHSKTHPLVLRELLKYAKVIVVAVGKEQFLDLRYWYTPLNAYIYDVGINVNQQGKVVGDVCGALDHYLVTRVPGGVGKLTVDALMWNTIDEQLWLNRHILRQDPNYEE